MTTEYLRPSMILYPHAKINLGLNVLARRTDGYHDIQSILVPIPIHDVLEAVVDPELEPNALIYTRSGLAIAGAVESDLCYKAVRLLQVARELPGIRLHLHKVIPMGAGLCGGSSDGAHTMLLLNDLLKLGLSNRELHTLAAKLGSDCPFFLNRSVQLATGRGEVLRKMDVEIEGLWLVLVNPGIHVSTAEAYHNTIPSNESWKFGSGISKVQLTEQVPVLHNTMEDYAFRVHPEIGKLKSNLLGSGALFAAMSGSGSSVFGLFEQHPGTLSFPADHRSWVVRL